MIGDEKEPAEFLEKKEIVLSWKEPLEKIRKGLKAWLQGAQAMAAASHSMSEALQGTDEELIQMGNAVSKELGDVKSAGACSLAIDNISRKIDIIDVFRKDCSDLHDLHLTKSRMVRKLGDAEKKGDQIKISEMKIAADTAISNYNKKYGELFGLMSFLITEAGGTSNPIGLVRKEIATFKHSQMEFYSSLNEICEGFKKSGSSTESVPDLGVEWDAFCRRKDTAIRDYIASNSSAPSSTTGASGTTLSGNVAAAASASAMRKLSSRSLSTSGRGNSGRIPPPPPPPAAPMTAEKVVVAKVLYDYDATNADELNIREGDEIVVLKQENDGKL